MFMVKFIEFLITKDLDIRHCVQDKMEVFRYNSCVQLYTREIQKRADITAVTMSLLNMDAARMSILCSFFY